MRSHAHEHRRTAFAIREATKRGVRTGLDLMQNLANPALTIGEVVQFLNRVRGEVDDPLVFIEEPLGPMDAAGFRLLRGKIDSMVCGGETITTPQELINRVAMGCYDFVQPDATVIGGMHAVIDVFSGCRSHGCAVVVHAWCGAVGLMANYHAALAGGGQMAEWPLPPYELRDVLLVEPLQIVNGNLQPPTSPGIGVRLTAAIESQFAFREDAVYRLPAREYSRLSDVAWK